MRKKNNDEIFNKLKANKLNNFIIPKIIQELYPKLKFQDYFNLKNDTVFRSKTTCVCDDCYLEITKYCSMAGSNNENLIRTLRKDECLSPFYDMVKNIRPKSVVRKTKNIILEDLNLDNKKVMNKNKKNKFEISINNNNSNLFSYLKEKDKKKIKKNLLTNYNNYNSNLNNKNSKLYKNNNNKNNGFDIIFPKLKNVNNLNLNYTNYDKNNGFKNITNRLLTDIYNLKDGNKESKKYNSKSKKDENIKNFLSKNDFTYFS
jgi:hypothetical protein